MTNLRELTVLRHLAWWRDWIDNRENPAFFAANEMKPRYSGIKVSILHLGGCYNLFLRNTCGHYEGITAEARDATVRDGQRLVIAPWPPASCVDCPPSTTVDGEALGLLG